MVTSQRPDLTLTGHPMPKRHEIAVPKRLRLPLEHRRPPALLVQPGAASRHPHPTRAHRPLNHPRSSSATNSAYRPLLSRRRRCELRAQRRRHPDRDPRVASHPSDRNSCSRSPWPSLACVPIQRSAPGSFL
jgi:hypothetical protein